MTVVASAEVELRADGSKLSTDISDKVNGIAKKAAVGFAAIFAAKEIIGFGKDSVKAFQEAEAAQLRLSTAFEKFPKLAGANIESLRSLNTALALKTKFDDDATASGQAVLAQFNLTADQLKTLTPLLQDFAARTGSDLPSAAQTFGKALLGQGRGLKEIGLVFKDTGSQAGNFKELVQGVSDKVGGFAEKEGKTATGRLEILGNQFGEIKEKIGSVLLPVLQTFADIFLKIVGFLQNAPEPLQAIAVALGVAAAAFVAITLAAKAFTVAQAALNIVLDANPIGLDRKSTRLNSSHIQKSRMPSSA